MCYSHRMPASSESPATRTVVLLRPSERKRLHKLAAAEHVSAGEILRRSLHSYENEIPQSEQQTLASLLTDMNSALDNALASIRSARAEVRENLDKIAELQNARA
jgi:esterase/lipase